MKSHIIILAGGFIIGVAILAILFYCSLGYVYSSEQYAFKPMNPELQMNGIEYFVTDTQGGEFLRGKERAPVFFCKFGNMIAVNVTKMELPWLRKMGNVVIVLSGDEGDSPSRAHSEVRIVVMDADKGEMCVTKPTAQDVIAIRDANRVEVKDHTVLCYDEKGCCHRIFLEVMHKMNFFARILNRCAIAVAARNGRQRENDGMSWRDPESGLRWSYVETNDGVEIVNTRTGGCAVSPMPTGLLEFPEFINGRPLKSIGSGAIVNGSIEKVIIPRTVERFAEKAPYSFGNMNLKRVEVKDGNAAYRSIDGLLYDVTGKMLLFVPQNVAEVRIPEGVTNVADHAFQWCHSIRVVTIPASVTVLEKNAFFRSSIAEVRFLGDAPKVPHEHLNGVYLSTPERLTTYANKAANGWRVNGVLPKIWCERSIVFE